SDRPRWGEGDFSNVAVDLVQDIITSGGHSASQLADPEAGQDTELASSMGLFLQKTNIIRDYLEDTQQGRAFWPQEAWVQFSDRLEDLAQPEKLESALSCLNLLVTDALRHVPDVFTYLARLRNHGGS
ncbi:squalene synthase, partial [Gadus morhua]|uniref:squalene synthase n=1 Tax=Gadus morhua TaxID=8049 RepID=UPI0011B6115D